ncbi:MAG: GGDEF domain-containing protein [Planctomycetota bacterium]
MSDDETRKADLAEIQRPPTRTESILIEILGPNLGKNYRVTETVITIGRDPACTITLDQENVSRSHCKLEKVRSATFVEDLKSTNGTFLNDVPIDRERLRHGDLLKIGGVIFKFVSGGNIEGLYHEEIYRMTITDGLTQVANKRYLLEFLEREISRAIRFGRPLAVIMLDLDHFKNINDAYGHLAGDHILRDMSAVLGKLVRREELLARYGGEEFVVVLPETGLSTATTIAEKARRMVEQHKFEFAGTHIPVTISLGAAELSPMAADPDNFLRAADEKLYAAKNAGRNRVAS